MAAGLQCCFQRYEKKYVITPAQQEFLLSGALPYLRPDEYGRYTICNIYYDTANWSLIRSSLEKPAYKEKLRVRSYGVPEDDGSVFVEIKKKVGGVVYKRRVIMAAADVPAYLAGDPSRSPGGQISREIDWFQHLYHAEPQVFIGYDRTAFAGIDDPELRMTFDTGLRWRTTALDLRGGDWGAPILPPGRILMELKIPGAAPMWLSRLLSQAEVYPTSFSKYGACYQNHILGHTKKEMNLSA